uniref:Uncharacterized protein n=1 Tax=Timema cristinae TaxID=61476 RepID=A0A7R9D582_TIMCR|nr:unnamed protein product [Timema cristinae]
MQCCYNSSTVTSTLVVNTAHSPSAATCAAIVSWRKDCNSAAGKYPTCTMDLSSKYTEDLDSSLRRQDSNNEEDNGYSLRVRETIGEAAPKTCQELIVKSEESKINQKWKKSRERNEELWERNIKKRARLSGNPEVPSLTPSASNSVCEALGLKRNQNQPREDK